MTEKTLSDRYRLENRIGSGGMATVYAGLDTVLRRRVAIKILREQFAADEDFIKRFNLEAQHAAKLSHPNVVNIYDVGHEGETYYIVMELVDGTTLGEMIQSDGSIPEPVAIDFATQICAGLAYAHRQGLLHRDIKPANILVTKDDVVKLSDFGIARAVTTQTVTVTQPGLVMGSVFYLSPEQAQGHELAATSDLYSLGVVIYQMLTGELPYTGESPVTVALKHVSSPIPAIDPDGTRNISPALAAIVRKLLQKDPAARFQSATEVATALREARESPTVTSPFDVADSHTPHEQEAVAAVRRSIPNPKPRPSRYPDRRLDVVAPAIAAGASGRRYAPLDDDDAVVARPSPFTPQRLAIAGALVLAAIVGYVVFNRPTQIFGPPVPVAVAAVTGRTVEDATNLLQAQGLEVKVVAVASDLVPKNRVVKQNPAAKTKVPPKSVVELDVSTGLPLVSLMDLRQYSKDDAERYLRNNKLLVKEVVRYDDKVRRGDVISQSPGPAAQVAIHSAVTLVISNGVRPVGVPDLVSHKLSDASKSLARLNLKLAVTERVPSDSIPADVIASQQPSPGTPVDPGTTISVTVSSGAPKMVLPDLNGRNVSDAMAALSAAGLVSRVNYIVDSSVLPGTVMQQDPAASAPTHKNATITLSVAVPGTVPDVGGTTLDQARTTLQNAGYKPGGVIFEPQGEAGRVIRTDPAAGAQLRPGETVNLHVSGQQ